MYLYVDNLSLKFVKFTIQLNDTSILETILLRFKQHKVQHQKS